MFADIGKDIQVLQARLEDIQLQVTHLAKLIVEDTDETKAKEEVMERRPANAVKLERPDECHAALSQAHHVQDKAMASGEHLAQQGHGEAPLLDQASGSTPQEGHQHDQAQLAADLGEEVCSQPYHYEPTGEDRDAQQLPGGECALGGDRAKYRGMSGLVGAAAGPAAAPPAGHLAQKLQEVELEIAQILADSDDPNEPAKMRLYHLLAIEARLQEDMAS